jgi:hypothetical protein
VAIRCAARQSKISKACFTPLAGFAPSPQVRTGALARLPRRAPPHLTSLRSACRRIGSAVGPVPNARPSSTSAAIARFPLLLPHLCTLIDTDTGPPLSSSFPCCPSPSVFFPLWCWIYLCFPVVWCAALLVRMFRPHNFHLVLAPVPAAQRVTHIVAVQPRKLIRHQALHRRRDACNLVLTPAALLADVACTDALALALALAPATDAPWRASSCLVLPVLS